MNAKMTFEQQMQIWENRSKDEFGTILKKIEKASMNYFECDEDEYGIRITPLSYPITGYSLDGNRKYTANVITTTLDDWDILEDMKVKSLVKRMNEIANA